LDEWRTPLSCVITAGRLNLDDASAEVAKHHSGVRTCDGSGQVENQKPLER
jgi:hypothetical protein